MESNLLDTAQLLNAKVVIPVILWPLCQGAISSLSPPEVPVLFPLLHDALVASLSTPDVFSTILISRKIRGKYDFLKELRLTFVL